CGRYFEQNTDQHQRQGRQQQRVILGGGGAAGDFVNLRGAGGAEDQGNAVEQERGGEGSEQKVLDGRFRAASGFLAVPSENVGGDGRDFESNEDHQQFDRRGEQAHPHGAKYDQGVELALVMAVFR